MSNTVGTSLKMSLFGESHGAAIGVVLDGLPAGQVIDWDAVRQEMARRAPGRNNLSTTRKEADEFEILSGYFEGHTTGTPLAMMIRNSNQHSSDYEQTRYMMRPGHADFTGAARYQGFQDYRGGGHFSGRLTAPLVFAGAIAKQILAEKGVIIGSHISCIGAAHDRAFHPLGESTDVLSALQQETLPVLDKEQAAAMEKVIGEAKAAADSVGGIVECMIQGLPAGLGNPFFDSVESCLSHALFSVPAVKGIEFGDGFSLAHMHGSQANDAMHMDGKAVKTDTNHNGGILGGITNGMPIIFRVVIKPTASIGQPQSTVNIQTHENCTIEITGRHDPCIVPRAIPVVEAVAAWTMLDIWLSTKQGR